MEASKVYYTDFRCPVGTSLLEKLRREQDASARAALREQANEAMADTIRGLAADTLDKVLYELSCQMKNCYSRSDA